MPAVCCAGFAEQDPGTGGGRFGVDSRVVQRDLWRVAAQLEVSKCHCIRWFTASAGISPGRYLTAIRIENAKRLLAAEAMPLTAIAALCGFSGSSYFGKVFRRYTGQRPANWQQTATYAQSDVNDGKTQAYA